MRKLLWFAVITFVVSVCSLYLCNSNETHPEHVERDWPVVTVDCPGVGLVRGNSHNFKCPSPPVAK